ncbi:uncharacterized protein UV8b_06863 [Ustilaginoidea virens]|uniref:Uncharacterized protein n=1 Tax=Ustilaginoidea virens TaxID=1159556 RepID=A0A063C929_USTVR|nr:uncharacterized protein UV8b_06863 [Ustilaginoidea virens]QUC22622.1 hypothetical protein UV8b_06863 [Ustilaginoidea virens]GAO16871.1 hypothetical protein UVI_02011920 [Ustilaginoidea virens]
MSATPLDSFRHDRPLAESIAAATRPIHAKLNKLIIARLPLALPPRAADPFPYTHGLLHVAPIYLTFESLWLDFLTNPTGPRQESSSSNRERGPQRPRESETLRQTLDRLYIPRLMRSDRLVSDVRVMTGWSEKVTREQMDAVGETGHLAEFVKHIRRAIKNKPHVLLSYSYIMFMALFAGGRFIRATLESAGAEFWAQPVPAAAPGHHPSEPSWAPSSGRAGPSQPASREAQGLPLRFFHFDTPFDGEDLKREFKHVLAESEESLSYRQKHDIVQEAICIFENMILVVAQLDRVVARPDGRRESTSSLATVITHPVANRFRDSVLVTRERNARSCTRSKASAEEQLEAGDGEEGEEEEEEEEEDQEEEQQEQEEQSALYPSWDNHPTIPAALGAAAIELCPAMSKSVRFERAVPQASRTHRKAGDAATGDMAESLGMASKRLGREQVATWVLGIVIGVIILGAVFSGRRASTG